MFMNGFLKWREAFLEVTSCVPKVLEIGGGSSTLYFLQKGLSVVCVEADSSWRKRLRMVAEDLGFDVIETLESASLNGAKKESRPSLHLVPAESFADIPGWVFDEDYYVSVSDGLERWESLEKLTATQGEGILIVDNMEYASDWGRLPIGSGYPERVAAWRQHLRSRDRSWLLFEQPEGRSGRGVPDHLGIEREGRKVTGVTWTSSSVAASLGLTATGTCLVSPQLRLDSDLRDLRERCPYPTGDTFFDGKTLGRSFD